MKTRRPILLLELFIALFMLATCLLPLMRPVPLFFSKEVRMLSEIELERLADLTYLDIKENLASYIKWEQLARNMKEIPLAPVAIELEGMKETTYNRSCKLWIWKEKEGVDNIRYRLLGCQVLFERKGKTKKYPYKLFVYRKEPITI